jgi:hypothetical protein
MLEVYEVTREPELLASAEKALEHLIGHVQEHPTLGISFLVSEGVVKLGGSALSVIALAKHAAVTDATHNLPLMQALARYIADSQGIDGKFIHQRNYPSLDPRSNAEVQFYPGQAILALVRLHSLDQKDEWLDLAERGARYLINVRDRGGDTDDLPHDHWLLYGLNELYRVRPDGSYLEHAMRIAREIAASQERNPYPPDRLGSYGSRGESTSTAARSEGLAAALALAEDFGQRSDLPALRAALELGIGFELQTQFQPERAMYLANPQRALGGFQHSLSGYDVRIDNVQHNISAILGMHRLLNNGRIPRLRP